MEEKQAYPGRLERLDQKIKQAEKTIARVIYEAEKEVRETVETVRERDPAARSTTEVLLLYSGVHAIMAHRVSHKLYEKKHYFAARAVSQAARFVTGIENVTLN